MASTSGIHYEFLAPGRIVVGWGRRRELGQHVRSLGRRAHLVWGSRTLAASGVEAEIVAALSAEGIEARTLARIDHEPLVEDIDRTTGALREFGVGEHDFVVAVGGGSAIDLAKAVAAIATQPERTSVRDYLEGVGRGLAITAPPLPVVALPTTAGTGAEATKNAVISSIDPPFKKSLRADAMMPRLALVDPELTLSSPPSVTAQSGLDAITQLIESYISRRARPIPQALAIQGLKLAAPAIEEAVRDGSSRPAREAMAHAALLSGLALANSGLGLAHGVAAALGIHRGAPHGLACAVMLPVALRVNRPVCQWPLAQLAEAIGVARTTEAASADAFVAAIEQLCDAVGVPRRLTELGVRRDQLPALALASRGNSMDGNPRTLSDVELSEILESIL